METELISYDKNGQWTLSKTKANGLRSGADFKSYRSMDRQGSLRRDHGMRGSLHGNPPARTHQMSDKKMESKPTVAVSSMHADKYPGIDNITD
jgi:hypothetical protein